MGSVKVFCGVCSVPIQTPCALLPARPPRGGPQTRLGHCARSSPVWFLCCTERRVQVGWGLSSGPRDGSWPKTVGVAPTGSLGSCAVCPRASLPVGRGRIPLCGCWLGRPGNVRVKSRQAQGEVCVFQGVIWSGHTPARRSRPSTGQSPVLCFSPPPTLHQALTASARAHASCPPASVLPGLH